MEHIVFRQAGDGDLRPAVVAVHQGDGVAHAHVQHIGQLLGDHRAVPGQAHFGIVLPVAQADKAAELLLIGNGKQVHIAVQAAAAALGGDGLIGHGHPLGYQAAAVQRGGNLGQFVIGNIVHQADLGAVWGNLVVLLVKHIVQGVAHAEAGDNQGGAPADADNGHPEPLLVPEQVAHGHLPGKGHPLPYRANPLQQHPAAGLGTPGPHKLGGYGGEGGKAGGKGRAGDAQHRRAHREQRHVGQQEELHVSHGVEHLPGIEDNGGDNGDAHSQAQHAPEEGGKEAVPHVLQGDGAAAVAQSLQAADLHPLVLHHAGHGGQAHQGRHQEENQGEHTGQIAHALRVLLVGHIAHVGVPAQNVPLAVLNLGYLPAGVVELLPGIGQLFLRLRLAVGILLLAVQQLLIAVVQLFPGVRQLLLRVGQLAGQGGPGLLQVGHAVVVLLPAVVQLGPGVRQLLFAIQNLLPGILQLGPAVVQLLLGVGQLLPAVVQLPAAVSQLLPAVLQLHTGLKQGLLRLLGLLHAILKLGPGLVQRLLALGILGTPFGKLGGGGGELGLSGGDFRLSGGKEPGDTLAEKGLQGLRIGFHRVALSVRAPRCRRQSGVQLGNQAVGLLLGHKALVHHVLELAGEGAAAPRHVQQGDNGLSVRRGPGGLRVQNGLGADEGGARAEHGQHLGQSAQLGVQILLSLCQGGPARLQLGLAGRELSPAGLQLGQRIGQLCLGGHQLPAAVLQGHQAVLVGLPALVVLLLGVGKGLIILLVCGLAVQQVLVALVVLGLAVLPFLDAVPVLGLAVGHLLHAVGILLLAVLQLLQGLGQIGLRVGNLLPGVRRLLLIGGQPVLILGQSVVVLRPAVVQLLPGVGKLLAGLGLRVVKLLLGVVQFLVGLVDDLVVPQGGPCIPHRLQGVHQGVHPVAVLIVVAVQVPGPGHGQIGVGVGLHIKGALGQQHESVDPAGAQGGGAPVGGQVEGGVGGAHDGKFLHRQGVLIVAGAGVKGEFVPDGQPRLLQQQGLHQALVVRLGHAALHQLGGIDALLRQ